MRIGGERGRGFGRAHEADRNPDDGGRLGRAAGEHLDQTEQGGRGVADRHHGAAQPLRPQLQGGGRAGGGELLGERRHARVVQHAEDLAARRQPGARHPVRHHLGVAQDRGAGAERAARRAHQIAAENDLSRRLHQTAGMDHAHHDVGLRRRERRQIRLRPDDGERPLVDGGAIAQIGQRLSHGKWLRGARKLSPPGRRRGGRASRQMLRQVGADARPRGRRRQGRSADQPARWWRRVAGGGSRRPQDRNRSGCRRS